MATSSFDAYSRPTTARQVLLMGGTGAALVAAGLLIGITTFWMIGAVLVLFAVATWPRHTGARRSPIEEPAVKDEPPAARPQPACGEPGTAGPSDTNALVRQMLAQYRYALLLRPRIAADLDETQFAEALEALQTQMALVPDGEVTLGPVDDDSDEDSKDAERSSPPRQHVVRVRRFFLDRYPVTNRQYFEFVAAGGYQQIGLWDECALPALLDFVDRTGEPGPRFWKEGCFLAGTDDHPVVGVCWHEAVAYARWVGKRLPSDAEWVKAGAWPVPLAGYGRVQRKYPWGNEMDRERANLWGSGPDHTVSVRQFAGGVSLGGVHQLVGNVWEWTNNAFLGGDHPLGTLTFKTPMKSIRGGAFDTYFDNQSTCQFQSGDSTLARKHNIGFRLAIGVCDLVLDHFAVAGATAAGATGGSPALAEQSRGQDARGANGNETDESPGNNQQPHGDEVHA